MQPQLIVIETPERINELRQYLSPFTYVSFDVETTGLDHTDQVIGMSVCAEESIAYYIILKKWNGTTLVDTGCDVVLFDLLELLKTKALIAHNSVFDCKMIASNFGVRLIESIHTDTMILAHLLNENRRVGLKDLCAKLFGEDSTEESKLMKASVVANGGTVTKKDYQMYKADPYLLGKYGAKDALLTLKLFFELVPELCDQKLYNFFYNEESMPLLRGPTYDLNTVGLQVDVQALATLQKTLEAECVEAKAYILDEIMPYIKDLYPGTTKKNQFNIGSSVQLTWLCFGVLNLEYGPLTKAGKEVCKFLGLKLPYTMAARKEFITLCTNSKDRIYVPEIKINGKLKRAKKIKDPWSYIACDKKTLAKLAPRHKWIEVLLEYQRKTKLLTTYIKGIQTRTTYGKIYPAFLQHGTTSGRYASRNPNFQNLPRDDKRIKSCIIPATGKTFVGADYSQLEPRIFAYVSDDEKLINSFTTRSDFYSVTGMEVYNKTDCVPQKDGPNGFGTLYPKLRQDSKTFTLASTYGATGFQLAPMMGKTADEAQADIDAYFKKFPKVKQMMVDSHEQAKTNGVVYSHFGRPRRIPEAKLITKMYGNQAHKDLPYDARKLLNLAVNHRIQATAANIVNRAMIDFYNYVKTADIDCHIVLQCHDSIIVECLESDAENVALYLQNSMESNVQLQTVDLEAVPKIGDSLAEV
jgi:DNA polymerase I-like protein with 3'-5' exonuclease and polymerase domains